MAKNHVLPHHLLRTIVCLCLLLCSGFLGPKIETATPSQKPVMALPHQPVNPREVLRTIYMAEIGIREATGRNDGERIAEYLRYCDLSPGYAWCAAFVSWCFGEAGYNEPRNPWSPALLPASRTIWDSNGAMRSSAKTPLQGDVFGIYYRNLRRIGHAGFVDRWEDKHCITVEGNTGPDLAIDDESGPANPIRAGPTEGVYRKRRPIRTIHAVANWIDNPS